MVGSIGDMKLRTSLVFLLLHDHSPTPFPKTFYSFLYMCAMSFHGIHIPTALLMCTSHERFFGGDFVFLRKGIKVRPLHFLHSFTSE